MADDLYGEQHRALQDTFGTRKLLIVSRTGVRPR